MEEVSESVWQGFIPVRVSLSVLDLASDEYPPDFYAMLPRVSYLPALYEVLLAHFENYIAFPSTMWLSYKNQPLKWQYPVGVLLDYLEDFKPILPWHLELNFNRYPSLLPYKDLSSVQRLFMNSLKESCALLMNTSNPIMSISKQNEELLWQSVMKSDLSTFKTVSLGTSEDPERIRYVPIRFLYEQMQGLFLSPLKPVNSHGYQYTIGEVVRGLIQGFVGRIIVQGIQVPDATPIFWMWKHLRHPDNFLYVILRSSS